MSRLWEFSPKSQPLLKRCLEAAAPCDRTNKWTKMFGLKNQLLADQNNTTINENDTPEPQNVLITDAEENIQVSCNIKDLFDNDTVLGRFDVFQEESMKNPAILTKLAENLSLNTIESLFQVIFDDTEKNKVFIRYFLDYFLPVFFRRDNSRLCTDVLLKCYNIYPEYFKKLFKIVVKDMQIRNNVLNDFILMLNEEKVMEFVHNFFCIELTPEEFAHNLFSIYTAYNACKKTENIHNYIFNSLQRYNKFCIKDKNYGRLMLSYLQNVNRLESETNIVILKELLENHRSAFKRPCSTILKEINDK